MIVVGVDRLIEDIEVSFWLPAVTFAMMTILTKLTSRSERGKASAPLTIRISLIFVLLLFAFTISCTMYQDRGVLLSLWERSPVLYSLLYLIGGALILAGIAALVYWKLRPALWRRTKVPRDPVDVREDLE